MRLGFPREPDGNSDLDVAVRWILGWIKSFRPITAPRALVSHTTRGVSVEPYRDFGKVGSSKIAFKGQWSKDNAYSKDDIVIRALDNEREDGNLLGTYIANTSIQAGAVTAAGEVPSFPLPQNSKWDLVSLVPNQRHVMRVNSQRIVLDAGAFTPGMLPLFDMESNKDDTQNGPKLRIRLEDFNAKIVKAFELETCEDGVPMYRIFLCSAPYTKQP